jgi:hypothetical protein
MSFAKQHQLLGGMTRDFVIKGLQQGKMRQLAEDILRENGRQGQRACALRPLAIVWLVIAMALYRKESIANVFLRLLYWMRQVIPALGRQAVTPEALYHARDRLGALPLKQLYRAMVLQHLNPILPTFHGFREWAVDGSVQTMPDTSANEDVFGRQHGSRGDAAYPQMQSMYLVAVATHQIRDCCFMPVACSEHAAIPFLLRNLGLQDLLMVDRGITSFELLLGCQKRGVQFLVRISSTWKPEVIKHIGVGDKLIKLVPCSAARSKLAPEDRNSVVIARLLEFRVGSGNVIRILTSLVDSKQYSALELAQHYHARWECELTFKELKIELLAVSDGKQKTHFRSKSPIGVLQEAWGSVIAHTLVRQLMQDAAEETNVPILELSFVDSLEVIKLMLPDLQIATGKALSALRRQLITDLGLCTIDRPRRNRAYARKIKRKMSNYQLKGPGDGEYFLDLKITFLASIL